MKKFFEDFKAFAVRGNVIDMAVGVIIGAAFGTITTSLVNDIFMPLIGVLTGGINFAGLFVALDGQSYASIEAAAAAGVGTVNYGLFIQNIINFILTAFCMFLVVRAMNKVHKKAEPASAKPKRICPFCKGEIAGELGQLERLQRLGIAKVRADAHIDIFALLIEAQNGILRQIADMLNLVHLAALFHQLDCFLAAENERLNRQVFLDDFRHFRLDSGQVFVGELLVAQIDVIVEALLRRGTVSEVRLRIQTLDCLRKDMRRGMADDVKLFLFGTFGNMSVVVDNLHDDLLLFLHIWDESKNARPSRFAEGRAIKI